MMVVYVVVLCLLFVFNVVVLTFVYFLVFLAGCGLFLVGWSCVLGFVFTIGYCGLLLGFVICRCCCVYLLVFCDLLCVLRLYGLVVFGCFVFAACWISA